MAIRKMAGWCLILLGAVRVFQAIHIYTTSGHSLGTISAVVISLLLTAGAAFLWLDRAPWRAQAR
jgi:hypothetical protein